MLVPRILKIYSVDARNHGDSPHDSEHSSAHMAADIAFLMQEENLKRISVMGHSMGGRTMMYFALKYPKFVEKAIIVDISPISVPKNLDALLNIFSAMKKISVSPKLSMAEGRAVAERQIAEAIGHQQTIDFILMNLKKLKTGEFVWRLNVAVLYEHFSRFRVIQDLFGMAPFTGPILFIAGNQSPYLNPEDWPKIKEIFPNAELEWLDAGHLIHFDEPEKFAELATNFLKR